MIKHGREWKKRKLNMMLLPLHLCNGLASPADAACREGIRYVATPVWRRFELSVVSCSLARGTMSTIQFIRWWQWLRSSKFNRIRSVYVRSERNADVGTVHRDNGLHGTLRPQGWWVHYTQAAAEASQWRRGLTFFSFLSFLSMLHSFSVISVFSCPFLSLIVAAVFVSLLRGLLHRLRCL